MLDSSSELVEKNFKKNNSELIDFIIKVRKWCKLKNELNHIELTQLVLEDSGYLYFLEDEEKNSKNPESLNRLDNIKEFIESLNEFENLDGFLEHVSLVVENMSITSEESITMMTMHGAKGLEFDNVFLSGWEEGVFPSKRSIEETGKKGLEEERRLAYVALTRARKNIYITYVNQNRYSFASHDYNLPSRFIEELPQELLEIRNSSYMKDNNFIDEFSQLENINDDYLSPGRKRILSKASSEQIDWDFNQDNLMSEKIEGSRVFHEKFGYGKILQIDGQSAEVNFEKTTNKKVFIKYLKFIL